MKKKLLAPENVCLQIIDVQQSLMAKTVDADKVVAVIEFMIRSSKILNIPILANTQYKKGLGPYVSSVDSLLDEVEQLDKTEFNALAHAATKSRIDNLPQEVDTIVLTGVETHICVYQTAMGILARGLDVWVVSDAVSSRNLDDHQAGLARLQAMGASIGSSEMLIYELLGKAGSPQFKEILPLIIARNKS